MLCTSNGVRVLPCLVAMRFHAIPWECAFAGRMTTERRPLKPLPVGGAKAAARDVLLQLKLYQLFCNIVGGVISPVLANLALDGLERELRRAFPRVTGGPLVNFVRYADDFIVTGRSKELLENEVKPLVEVFLRARGLELSQEKTTITHVETGFDFLGQNLRKYRDGEHRKLLIKPALKNVQAHLATVRAILRDNKQLPAGLPLAFC